MTAENGERSAPAFRRTDRTDAPYYLARYTERAGLKRSSPAASPTDADEDLPLYLRRFRERGTETASAALLEVDGERFTREFAGTSRDKEIVPPPERRAQEDFATEIRIIRHGITQGYQTDSGLTPMGGWQSHQRGHSLSKSVRPGGALLTPGGTTPPIPPGRARRRRGLLEPAPFGISSQVVRRVGAVRTAEGLSGPLPVLGGHECPLMSAP